MNDNPVLLRTPAGQREVVVGAEGALSTLERRMLLVVNGHTPLDALIALGVGGPDDVGQAVQRLRGLGLVDAVRSNRR